MPPKPQSVSTAADELYDLVREAKEISFKNAAKKLNVPVSTIEAWATFLEEDDLLAIKYKMTTPYLTLPSQKKKGKEKAVAPRRQDAMFLYKVKEAEARSDLEKTGELIESAAERTSHGEFGMLEHIEKEAAEKLRKVIEFILSNVHLSPQKKAQLEDEVGSIEKKIENAATLLKQRKFDEANKAYADSQARMRGLLEKAKEEFSEGTEAAKADESSVKKLLQHTYELLDQGKAAEAEENYERIKQMFSALSTKFSTEESELQDSIIKLNRDLVVRTNRIREQQVKEGTEKINSLIKLASESIKKKQFNSATAYYVEIKQIFEKMPTGFAKEKRQLKEQILKVFEKIAREREVKLKQRFELLAKHINSLLGEARKALSSNNVSQATTAYKEINKYYANLPTGFMKEQFELHRGIISVYNQLSERLETTTEKAMSAKTSEILRLLTEMKQLVKENQMNEATSLYSHINRLFAQLPEGFVEKKTELQEKIIDIYEELLQKKDKRKDTAFKNSVQGIERMIKEADEAVNGNDYARAYSLYKRIKHAYIGMQPVNIQQRQATRNRILALYRSILTLRNQRRPMNLPPLGDGTAQASPYKDLHRRIEELKTNSRAKVRLPPAARTV